MSLETRIIRSVLRNKTSHKTAERRKQISADDNLHEKQLVFIKNLADFIIIFNLLPDASGSAFCGCLVAGIPGSNPARGMDVCLLCLCSVLSCVGRGLCEGMINLPEESYRV
jgi:hypothetical protein